MRIVNLGILAHVDAGKTTLADQLLFQAGVLSAPGSVDHGTTQTDTLDMERQRGITIQSSVVSFSRNNLKVNLIDTPGHPDFIAEVERPLRVLDGVVLVASAVEGIQPQTRRLFRVIRGKQLPCVIFINKIDRKGARDHDVMHDLQADLGALPLALAEVAQIGTSQAVSVPLNIAQPATCDAAIEVLAEHDPDLLDQWVADGGSLDPASVRVAIRDQFRAGVLQPVVFGSAMTGEGVPQLLDVLAEIVPRAAAPGSDGPLAAEVFKVNRTASGERSVLCRVWQGTPRVRDTVCINRPHEEDEIQPERITSLTTFQDGQERRAADIPPGEIVRLGGLASARIGDWLGTLLTARVPAFEPPVFEYQVLPTNPEHRFDLLQALTILADEDPLIGVRTDEVDQAAFIHLYGEVQREVVDAMLHDRFGLAVTFGEPAVICVERLRGPGSAAEIFGETSPPFYATVGFRIGPRQGPDPVWTFTPGKAKRNFFDAAESGGRATLAQGPHGWPVVDVDVEVTDLIYLVSSVPADYRRLAALVMADAVADAGTVVCEPVHWFTLRTPVEHSGTCIHLLSTHRATIESLAVVGDYAVIQGVIPAATVDVLGKLLPSITRGRADLDTRFHDYQPMSGEPPQRQRTDLNPYNRIEYLSRLKGRF